VYRKWLGKDYDIGALDVVLCTAAAGQLDGDPPWLQVVGGSGAAKTETIMPLTGAGAVVISTISGEAALLSGTAKKERAKNASGGLLRKIGPRGMLVIKDFTSILSMNRDTRALVLAAMREIYDGRWSRDVGTDGGQTLTWTGRLVVIGAVTTAWDSAYQVVSLMGDRFALVRLDSDGEMRRKAGKQAMANVNYEGAMRTELSEAVGALLGSADAFTRIKLDESETDTLLAMADLVTRARTAVERDYQGNPMFAHGLEMPTRFAKQLVQIMQGGLSLGMSRDYAMRAAERCARDTMPPLRRLVLADVAQHPGSFTPDVADRVQIPKTTVDRTLQELQLLGLLRVEHIPYGESERIRWMYSLAPGIQEADLAKCTRNVSKGA
jgi:DNA-binding MarR family transcriptional regulator